MLICMLLFGTVFTVHIGSVLTDNEAPLAMKLIFHFFMTGWIGGVTFMLVSHLRNLRGREGLSFIFS